MKARGERILIFGDSLSHPGSDSGPAQSLVTATTARRTSAPGDMLASIFLEQGADAVMLDAKVSRSAYNYWSREPTTKLMEGVAAFAPTQVIVMLGTNDIGLSLSADQKAFEALRDAFKNMGAEVWAVGPFTYVGRGEDLNPGAEAVHEMMASVFGANHTIDGRPLSVNTDRSSDGVHFTPASAEGTAQAVAAALLAQNPIASSTWMAIGAGVLGVLGILSIVRFNRGHAHAMGALRATLPPEPEWTEDEPEEDDEPEAPQIAAVSPWREWKPDPKIIDAISRERPELRGADLNPAAPQFNGTPIAPSPESPSEEGYIYHATNLERVLAIAEEGLEPHGPSFGTDQDTWPDGSEEDRSYWITRAASAYSFAPEEGPAVLVRAMRAQLDTKAERGTGDIVTTKTVPASKLEIFTDAGWEPLQTWAASQATELSAPKMLGATFADSRERFQSLVQEEPPQFAVAEDLLRQEGVNLRAMMNGEQVLHFVLYTKALPGDTAYQTKERKVGGGFTPASKDGHDDRSRASWIDFYAQHGPSRYTFSKKLDKPIEADQARKMIAATIWEISKRLAPFSLDTDEATIQRVANSAVKQRHNIAKRYADIA